MLAAAALPAAAEAGRPGRLHHLLVITGLFLYCGARLPLGPPSIVVGVVDPMSTLMQITILLGSSLACLIHWRRCAALLLPAWPFLLLIAFIASSSLWSNYPDATLRRSVSLVALMLFALSTHAVFGMTRTMRLALGLLLVLAVASLAVAAVRPDIGYDVGEYANAIRGVFLQKNTLGFAMTLCVLSLSYLVLERGKLRLADGLILLFLLAMLVLARATTAFLLTAGTGMATILMIWLDRGRAWTLAAVVGIGVMLVGAMLVLALVDTDALFEAIGKDSTLTGRTEIWAESWRAIADRPLLGYGYAAFWNQASPIVRWIWIAVGWEPPTSHSGYLEILLQLGWFGMGLAAVMALATIARAATGLRRRPRNAAFWTLLFLSIMAIQANGEAILLNPDLFLLFWVFALLTLSRPRAAERQAAPPPAPAARSPHRPIRLIQRPVARQGAVPVFRRRVPSATGQAESPKP
jgi:exopolysaccharide production protein ExoQ